MPLNDQDARALTYLARRIRQETHGAGVWDEAGTWAEASKLIGRNLVESIEMVTRHAADPTARTPGAIRRPFLPGAQQHTTQPTIIPKHRRCAVCSLDRDQCGRQWDDHEFRLALDLKRDPDVIHQIVEATKGELQRTREAPEPVVVTPDPRADVARAAMSTPEIGDDHE